MPGYTIHLAVHTDATNARAALEDIETRLRSFERAAEKAGVVFHTQMVTDEDGEDVDLDADALRESYNFGGEVPA